MWELWWAGVSVWVRMHVWGWMEDDCRVTNNDWYITIESACVTKRDVTQYLSGVARNT